MSDPSTRPRYCPLCDVRTAEATCAKHGVPTVLAEAIEDKSKGGLPSGTMIGARYRVDELLGRGGMGDVVLATQLGIDRRVAIKTLNASTTSSSDGMKRFYREARAMVKMEHPNVVKVFDFGIDDRSGAPYLVMEYLRGRTLGELLEAEGRLPEARTCRLLSQVAKALVEANAKGIVHRDLKPENIQTRQLADGEEFVKVLDFGIAKVAGGNKEGQLTRVGAMVGTPAYMSPEQIRGKAVDTRSDLYGLGCILHECLTGAPPFEADDVATLVVNQLTLQPPPLPGRLVDGKPPSEAIVALRDRLLAKAPTGRPDTPSEVARILAAIGHGDTEMLAAAVAPEPPRTVPHGRDTIGAAGSVRSANAFAETAAMATPSPPMQRRAALSTQPGPVARAESRAGSREKAKARTAIASVPASAAEPPAPAPTANSRETVALSSYNAGAIVELGDDDTPRPSRWVFAAVLLVPLILGVAWWATRGPAEPPSGDSAAAPDQAATSTETPAPTQPVTASLTPTTGGAGPTEPNVAPAAESRKPGPEVASSQAVPTAAVAAVPTPAVEPAPQQAAESPPPAEQPAPTVPGPTEPVPTEPGPSVAGPSVAGPSVGAAERSAETPEAQPAGPGTAEPAAPPAAQAQVSVTLASKPDGAKVTAGDEVLGRTPVTLTVPNAGLSLKLARAGYVTRSLKLTPESESEVTVALKRRSRPKVRKPSPNAGKSKPPRSKKKPAMGVW